MTFRFARHTNDLEQLKSFYTSVLGLELIGGFENHNGIQWFFFWANQIKISYGFNIRN